MKRKHSIIVIILIAILLRIPLLLKGNSFINSDLAVNLLTLKNLFYDGKIQFFYWGISYQELLEGILVSPILLIGKFTFISWLIGAIAIHVIFIYFFWILTKKLFNLEIANWTALFLAISPWRYTWLSVFSCLAGHTTISIWFLLYLHYAIKKDGVPCFRDDLFFGFLMFLGVYDYKMYQMYIPGVLAFTWLSYIKDRNRVVWKHVFFQILFAFIMFIILRVIAHFTDFPVIYKDYDLRNLIKSARHLPEMINAFFTKLPLYEQLLMFFGGDYSIILSVGLVLFSIVSGFLVKPSRDAGVPIATVIALFFSTFILFPLSYQDILTYRYLCHLYPLVMLLFASLLFHSGFENRKPLKYFPQTILCLLMAIYALNNLSAYYREGFFKPGFSRIEDNPYYKLSKGLEEAGIKYAISDYWIAYVTTFYSDEKIQIDPMAHSRNPLYRKNVIDHWPVPVIEQGNKMQSPCEKIKIGEFTIYVPKSGNECTGKPQMKRFRRIF